VAARLEQLNKEYGTYIMMGEATHLAIADNINCEFMCETPVKGRNEKVRVYTLKG
jgi:class 3 adenylate cyclase